MAKSSGDGGKVGGHGPSNDWGQVATVRQRQAIYLVVAVTHRQKMASKNLSVG